MSLLVIVYSAVFLIPTYRELGNTSSAIEEQSISIAILTTRVEAAQVKNVELTSFSSESVSQMPTNGRLQTKDLSQTFAQLLGRILCVFESQYVECIAAIPDSSAETSTAHGAVVHRVTLLGGFQNVLSSMETIESEIPAAVATEFSMTRPIPSEPCRWEITFQFKEGQ